MKRWLANARADVRSGQSWRAGLSSLILVLLASAALGQGGVQVEEIELDNGMRFLLVERPELTTIAAGWVAHVGSADERPGITGLAHLFEHMMFKGTHTIGTRDAERDLAIIDEQEGLQEKIREIYRDQRRRYRLGEIDDPFDPEGRTEELKALEAEFDALVESQRELMIKDEFSQLYTEAGGSMLNAFTNADETVYMVTIPANKLELWFWLESDRLLNPIFREFYSERDVVKEERRLRTDSTPTGEYDEQLNAMFWQSHPYSWPIIGWPSDLQVISKAQADEFFATYYAPNNITAVLVGNFDADDAKALAERYFGRLPRGEVEPPDVVTLEMEQKAEKRMTAECDCPPQIQIRYHTVPFGHADSYALDVVGGVLNGRTGRLFKRMVDGEEVASSAAAFQSSDKWAGSFSFRAEAKGEATPQQIEASWNEVVSRLQDELVSDEELARVKRRTTADVYRRLQNPFFLMIQLAVFDGIGDWRYLNTLAERTDAVSAEDVQRVAKTYFGKENRLVGQYFRKAGTVAEEIPPELEGVPAEVRKQVLAQTKQLASITDIAQLQAGLAQMEAQAGQVPPEMQGPIQFMKRKVEERIAELEAAAGGEE